MKKVAPYLCCFMLGLIIGSVGIYLLSWKLGVLTDIRLDWLFNITNHS